MGDDLREANTALRVEYDGFGTGHFVDQLLLLEPGRYVFTGLQRVEGRPETLRLQWRVDCVEGPSAGVYRPATGDADNDGWIRFQGEFQVPDGCSGQWLRLEARPEDQRSNLVMWFDDLAIDPI